MIILKKLFSTYSENREKAKKKVNSIKGIGTGLVTGTSVGLGGTIATLIDQERFHNKNMKRVNEIEDRYEKFYKDKYDSWLDKIKKRKAKIKEKINNHKTGDTFRERLDDEMYKFNSNFNLIGAESRLRNEAFERYEKNMEKVRSKIGLMKNRVRKAANKRAAAGLLTTALGSVALGTAAGTMKKKSLDKKLRKEKK